MNMQITVMMRVTEEAIKACNDITKSLTVAVKAPGDIENCIFKH